MMLWGMNPGPHICITLNEQPPQSILSFFIFKRQTGETPQPCCIIQEAALVLPIVLPRSTKTQTQGGLCTAKSKQALPGKLSPSPKVKILSPCYRRIPQPFKALNSKFERQKEL